MKQLILGDMHGHIDYIIDAYLREDPDTVILLGDYLDSFTVKPEDQKKAFDSLLELRLEHLAKNCGPFVMLLGNHDLQYILHDERYSGKNQQTMFLMNDILKDCIDSNVITMIYTDPINKIIYSHAGVTNTWLSDTCRGALLSDANTMSLDFYRFTYGNSMDCHGDNVYSSPVWVRPYSLSKDSYIDENGDVWKQVVGHTITNEPLLVKFDNSRGYADKDNLIEDIKIICLDTLPRWYMVQETNDNGVLVSREFKAMYKTEDSYRQ